MSKNKFIKVAKLLEINKKEAEEFYDKQAVNQIYKNRNQKKNLQLLRVQDMNLVIFKWTYKL